MTKFNNKAEQENFAGASIFVYVITNDINKLIVPYIILAFKINWVIEKLTFKTFSGFMQNFRKCYNHNPNILKKSKKCEFI